jgi:glycosyltransferase involved in cell wall biosynthesis
LPGDKPPIKLTFLVRSLDYGGAQRQLVTLAKGLDKDRFAVTVLCFYSGQPLERELEGGAVQIISLDKRGRWDLLPFLWRLIRQAKRLRPDIMHGYLDIPNLLALFIKRFVHARVVWGVRAAEIELCEYDWLLRLAARLERLCSRFPDLIIVNSVAAFERHLARGFPARKMVLIPNGIDTERFKPDAQARARLRSEWKLSENTTLIGSVGRLDPVKDLPVFLRAAAIVCGKLSDIRVACIGTGPMSYERQLRTLASELGLTERVIWGGARPDVASVYNALDLLVSSSRGESFPNAIAEAMSCGIPCVVTDAGDSGLLVGDCGVVVPIQDPQKLAQGIIHGLALDRNEVGGKARARIVNEFSLEKLAQSTGEALRSLIHQSPPR